MSVLGDNLYSVAAMWLVYELTGSTVYTGLAGALPRIPQLFTFAIGPLVDRARLGRILVLSEVYQALIVLIVPLTYVLGMLDVFVVLAIMPLLVLSGLFAGPAQTAALPLLVDDERLVRANSVFSVATQVVSTIAKGAAGVLITLIGAVGLYLIDAVTFGIAVLLFLSLSIPVRDRDDGDTLDLASYRKDLREGIDLLIGGTLGQMLIASFFVNFLLSASMAVLPAFADGIGGPEVYGFLLASMTVGSVLGSVGASVVDRLPLGRVTVVGFVLAGVLWTGAVVLPGAYLTAVLLAAARVPTGIYNVSIQATFQTAVPDDLLGRVVAVISSATNLVVPAGLLIGGVAGEQAGSSAVMLGGGVGLVLMAGYWLASPSLRRFKSPVAVTPGEFG